MLVQLSISNFAIIKHLDIAFRPGLNILSGETGAGKSIIINAMNLILGGRASSDLIRSGSEEARVEALFSIPGDSVLANLLPEFGLPFDEDLLIKRTIFREGRNKITVNDSMITLQTLSRIGDALISISGQHEHQRLLKPEIHLYILDEFGGLVEDRLQLNDLAARFQALKRKMESLETEIRATRERQDLARFQLQEIEGIGPIAGEDGILSEEKKRLQHAEELQAMASEGYQSLYEQHDSALSSVFQCIRRLERGVQMDSRLATIKEALEDIGARIEDAALGLRDFQKSIQVDPYKLEEVDQRLQSINGLKRKYGPTLEDVLAFKGKLATMMDGLEERRNELSQLEKRREALETELSDMAGALSGKRRRAASKLEKAVEKELQHLHMRETRFRVDFQQAWNGEKGPENETLEEMRADGWDRLEFLLSANVGEDLKPLSKIASGGELSRIMLALKSILAGTASIETVIFDEVDSGISGATAEVVGEKLLSLSRYHQVLCITHLPQIASKGQTHFKVKKEVADGRTQTTILELDRTARVHEIARLLGGKQVTPHAVAHAKEMLG